MAAFCGQCGAPVSGGFCGKCGARAGQPAPASYAPPPPPAPVPPVQVATSSGSSAVKIVLIVVGILFLFSVLGIAALYFTGRSIIRRAEMAGVNVGAYTGGTTPPSSGGGLFSSIKNAARGHRDGCALLSAGEVASILGVEVGKTDGQPKDGEKGEHCDYFLKPGTSDAYAQKFKDSVKAAEQKGKETSDVNSLRQLNEQGRRTGMESVIKNMLRAGGAVANDGSQPFFSFTIDREGGKDTFGVLERTNSAGRVLMNGAEMVEKLSGVGDRAFLTPLDAALIVLKGDTCITFNLTQVPDGKEKGAELAKLVVSRL